MSALEALVPTCREAIVAGFSLVVSRFERNRHYPWVDTKLNVRTGEDFPEPPDLETDFRGRSAVYGWIQGRGLESLAGHAAFLAGERDCAARADRMLAVVADRIMALRNANGGRFFFLFAPDGRPFRCGDDGRRQYVDPVGTPPGFADLFVGKGLAAAGSRLGRPDLLAAGVETFRETTAAIAEGRFVSDQISFDPRNPTVSVPGRHAQGPWMIALGGYALMCELLPRDPEWVEGGSTFLRRLLNRHILARDDGRLRRLDFVEYTNDEGRPWFDQEKVLQDPGHAIEFTGLAARFLLRATARPPLSTELRELAATCRETLPGIFLAAVSNGFQRRAGGICKTFDLVARVPVNDDMPWWALPEAMRAAALLLRLTPDHSRRAELVAATVDCARALFGLFRSPVPGFFLQTRDAKGDPSPVIPATPDADPGYHTGLCLIDFVNACIEKDVP